MTIHGIAIKYGSEKEHLWPLIDAIVGPGICVEFGAEDGRVPGMQIRSIDDAFQGAPIDSGMTPFGCVSFEFGREIGACLGMALVVGHSGMFSLPTKAESTAGLQHWYERHGHPQQLIAQVVTDRPILFLGYPDADIPGNCLVVTRSEASKRSVVDVLRGMGFAQMAAWTDPATSSPGCYLTDDAMRLASMFDE